jgi:KRAB domain-containing zinc finger protein
MSSSSSLSSTADQNQAEVTREGVRAANSKEQGEAADLTTTTTKHRCPECGKCLATKSNLERHYRLHIGDRPFECETCGREFSDMSNLRKHEQVHSVKQATANDSTSDPIADSPGVAAMDDCSDDGSQLNSTHVGKGAVQETSDSGAETTGKKSKGQLAEFPCLICHKVFPYRSHLYEHVKVHTNDRPYQCEVCGKAFKRTGDLTTHARFHDAEKQFECTDCGQRFRWKNGLDRHRRIHTGERPFLCTVCGRAFADWGSHKQHVRSHMLLVAGIQPERFPCKVCGKTFAWKRGLARHARSHAAGKGF